MARILVVKQDAEQRNQLLSLLTHVGHDVRGAADGERMAVSLSRFVPEIVLLSCNIQANEHDVATGSAYGYAVQVAQHLHQRFGTAIGIIMTSDRNTAGERIACRRAGADHYLVKPITDNELLVVIENLTRRLTPSSHTHAWRLFANDAILSAPNHPAIALTGWEVVVLNAIASSNDQQISRTKLIEAIGKNPDVYDQRALEAGISRLRRKLPPTENGTALQAIRGFGYRFNPPIAVVR
jgi:DNA-binding response OmpR family regulator